MKELPKILDDRLYRVLVEKVQRGRNIVVAEIGSEVATVLDGYNIRFIAKNDGIEDAEIVEEVEDETVN